MIGFKRNVERAVRIGCLVGVSFWLISLSTVAVGEYVERISSFETPSEAVLFTYDAGEKGSAKVSDAYASDGEKSLEVRFALATEGGKMAGLGRSLSALPFDWSGIDALMFDVYNPGEAPVPLSLEVKSGLYDADPSAKLYRTKLSLPPQEWTSARLARAAMGEDLSPGGVLYVHMTIPEAGTLYVDNVRFVASAPPAPETKYVRLTWTDDPSTTQTITWQSRAETGEVRFGGHGEPLVQVVRAQSVRAFPWGHGVFHEVTLTGLAPDTVYDYQIRSGDSEWTAKRSFRTAPASDEAEFTFLAGSDTKSGRGVIMELLKVFEPDDPRFMLYAGDAPRAGGLAPLWDRWFQAVEPFASRRPIMQSTGNHELGGDPDLVNFTTYNALPKGSGHEAYYSFDYGPVHAISLDSASGRYPEQVEWLKKDLAATKKPWKVVYFHHPPFSSGSHGSNEELRRTLGPIFSQYHVNLVVNGHDHTYERSKPVNLLTSPNAPVASYKEGTAYVVSGGAGASTYKLTPGNWWTATMKEGVYHLLRIRVNGSRSMILEAVDEQGNVFDRATLEN